MRGGLALIVTVLLLGVGTQGPALAAAPSAEPASKLPSLAAWEGQYPVFDSKVFKNRPEGQRFWDDARIQATMKKSLPAEVVKKITQGWEASEGPPLYDKILRRGDILYVFACRPRVCASYAARLYFNMSTGSVQACWTEVNEKSKKQTDFWIDKKVRRLGPDACTAKDGFAGYDAFADKKY